MSNFTTSRKGTAKAEREDDDARTAKVQSKARAQHREQP